MVQRKKCRSRQELFDEYSLAKFGFNTAENEPPEGSKNVCSKGPRWWWQCCKLSPYKGAAEVNTTLMSLDLGYNCLGADGARFGLMTLSFF